MATKTFIVKELTRTTTDGDQETLEFKTGVNVLVGRPNTGKSKWLAMLDYLLGDRGQPDKAFGADLSEKYTSISAIIDINGEEIHLERNWKRKGLKTKVIVNDEPINLDEFSDFLLEKASIPILHYPKGSPYRGTWPVLSWRVLFRHIYRQQRFWSDFADKQPEVEQHACLMLFLGIAEVLYSEQYGELIKKRKRVFQLEAMKDEFQKMLDEISRDLIDDAEVGVGITKQSIGIVTRRLESEIKSQQEARDVSLNNFKNEIAQDANEISRSELERLGESWANLQIEIEESQIVLKNIDKRLSNLKNYQATLKQEIEKIERADVAGKLLTRLKITHCPACDQSVHDDNDDLQHCFLCHQSIPILEDGDSTASERLSAEVKHLKEEQAEIDNLVENLSTNKETATVKYRQISEDINRIKNQLDTVRRATASIVSPDLSIFDMEIGRLQERIRQLERIRGLLDYRVKLTDEIDEIQKELADLELEVNHLVKSANFNQAEDILSDGMTSYLNALNAHERVLWDLGRTKWRIKERTFDVQIGDSSWTSKLGGTLTLYFLIAYHYALLSLTNTPPFHYPGFLVLDFQAKLDDGTIVKDEENFILEPFVNLLNQEHMKSSQVIAAGAAFEGLDGANRIELEHVWV